MGPNIEKVSMKSTAISSLSLAFLSSLYANTARGDEKIGRFSPLFAWPMIPIHASLLPSGKVLSFGTSTSGIQQAYNYDIWTPGPAGSGSHEVIFHGQPTDIFCSSQVLLSNGKVILAGGDTRIPESVGISDALTLDSKTNEMSRAEPMQFARWYPTMITLPNGEAMIQGGREGEGQAITVPEIFSLKEGKWRTLWGAQSEEAYSDLEHKWWYPRAFVTPSGLVFGMSGNEMFSIDWRENGKLERLGLLPNKTRSYLSTAVMYRPGEILQVGGSVAGDVGAAASQHAIRVDVRGERPIVTELSDMKKRRAWANSTVLPNGEVLITGGSGFDNRLEDTGELAELWNPDTQTFRPVATAAVARLYHSTSLLLPDGTVLVGGGGAPGPLNNKNAEIFYPPYLFKDKDFAERPLIEDLNNAQTYQNTMRVKTKATEHGRITRVTLLRTGAVTHSFDQGQRFLELSFEDKGHGELRVTLPDNANLAPPGFYLLYVLSEKGVPSVGRILSLNHENSKGEGSKINFESPIPSGLNKPVIGLPKSLELNALYRLSPRHSQKCLDIRDGGNPINGTRLQQWECTGAENQIFRLEASAIPGGFRLVNPKHNKCIDAHVLNVPNGTFTQQWDCNQSSQQTFRFIEGPLGSYKLRFDNSGRCLDVSGVSRESGADMIQWDCDFANYGNQDFDFHQLKP